jgi:hypothetical protein
LRRRSGKAAAIEASRTGSGETEYFRFKCCRNHNLHLEFKRLDLVEKLNAIAGGMRLRGESKERAGNTDRHAG